MINIFLNKDFTFNNKYSSDFGISIITFDNSIFNNIGLEYKVEMEIEHDLVDYNPYYTQRTAEIDNIELNLLAYDEATMRPLKLEEYDMEEIYNWLITDDFAPFITDDEPNVIYYLKAISITKVFTFNEEGYLKVIFKPYSNYRYERMEYTRNVTNSSSSIDINNPSRIPYSPMIEITNHGNESTINKIGEMEIMGIKNNEVLIIDNLSKLVQNSDGVNRFSACNRKWLTLDAKKNNTIKVEGNMTVRIICEFPILH